MGGIGLRNDVLGNGWCVLTFAALVVVSALSASGRSADDRVLSGSTAVCFVAEEESC